MPSSPSAHTRLGFVPRLQALDLPRRSVAVLPDVTTRSLHVVDRDDPARDHGAALSDVTFDVTTSTPFGAPVELAVDLLYRDAANYKNSARFVWHGTLDAPSLDIIATALMGLAPAAFGEIGDMVPDPFGLPHLASLMEGGGPDMDGHDHVWHTVEGLGLHPSRGSGSEAALERRSLEDLRRASAALLPTGFDLVTLIERYTAW